MTSAASAAGDPLAAVVEAFLAWAATDDGIDEGGVVLAVYAGAARLHPVRADERDKLIARWLETRRRYP